MSIVLETFILNFWGRKGGPGTSSNLRRRQCHARLPERGDCNLLYAYSLRSRVHWQDYTFNTNSPRPPRRLRLPNRHNLLDWFQPYPRPIETDSLTQTTNRQVVVSDCGEKLAGRLLDSRGKVGVYQLANGHSFDTAVLLRSQRQQYNSTSKAVPAQKTCWISLGLFPTRLYFFHCRHRWDSIAKWSRATSMFTDQTSFPQ
jgi:hypothetical protein